MFLIFFQEAGYESDSTVFEDSDCEGIIDEMLTTENEDKESYKAFNLNIMEISDIETSEDEDQEERMRRIEQLAAGMALLKVTSVQSKCCYDPSKNCRRRKAPRDQS